MSLDLVIGHKGEDHVTSADFARLLKLIIGPTKNYENANDCLILRNPELSALVSDNTITLSITGGYYSICGRFAYSLNTTTLTVQGVVTSGNKRKDAIIVEFNRVNNIESVEYKIIQGTETSSTPSLPALPHSTGNPEVNATFQMLIGALNIDGPSATCEPLESYGEYGRPMYHRVRSLYDSFWNYVMLLKEVSVEGSYVGIYGIESYNFMLFSLLKEPISTSVVDVQDNSVRVGASSLIFADYLGDTYKIDKQSVFTVSKDSYYMAELDVTLDLNKYFAHHEQDSSSNDFPFSTSMVLLKAWSGSLTYSPGSKKRRFINRETSITTTKLLTLGQVSTDVSNQGRVITFHIPLVFFYVPESGLVKQLYNLERPDVFQNDPTFKKVSVVRTNERTHSISGGEAISVVDVNTKLPVGFTKRSTVLGEEVTITNYTSGQAVDIVYYSFTRSSEITEIVQPSA